MIYFVLYGIIILQGKVPCKQTGCNTNCKGVVHMKIKIPYVVFIDIPAESAGDSNE